MYEQIIYPFISVPFRLLWHNLSHAYMNYELAKKLKDAGFPDELSSDLVYHVHSSDGGATLDKIDEVLPSPTLSNFIEACGKMFAGLYRTDVGQWKAPSIYLPQSSGSFANLELFGHNPEEAVALL